MSHIHVREVIGSSGCVFACVAEGHMTGVFSLELLSYMVGLSCVFADIFAFLSQVLSAVPNKWILILLAKNRWNDFSHTSAVIKLSVCDIWVGLLKCSVEYRKCLFIIITGNYKIINMRLF